MTLETFEPTCRHCTGLINPSQPECPWCFAPQLRQTQPYVAAASQTQPYAAVPSQDQPYATVAGKTPGIAVLLSLLWLGAGHLYCNRTTTGIVLAVCDLILLIIFLIPFGFVVAVPIWLVATPIVMVLAAQAARDFNARNDIALQ